MLYVYYGAVGIAILMVALLAMGAFHHDMDMDHDADADHDHDAEGESEGFSLLSLLGVGRAPLSILAVSYSLTFGVAGILFVLVSHSWLVGYEMWSLGFAATFAVVSSSIFARVLHYFVPSVESYTKKPSDLTGRTGVAMTTVKKDSGSVDVRDVGGTVHRLPAVTESGEIAAGESILVVLFDEERRLYVVEQLPA